MATHKRAPKRATVYFDPGLHKALRLKAAETEQSLYQATGRRWWPYLNLYLVTWGQNVCRPVYPRCAECVILEHCPQIGVTRVSKAQPGRAVG